LTCKGIAEATLLVKEMLGSKPQKKVVDFPENFWTLATPLLEPYLRAKKEPCNVVRYKVLQERLSRPGRPEFEPFACGFKFCFVLSYLALTST